MKTEIEELSMQEQFELAKQKTAQMITRGRKTAKELTDKLARYGFAPDVCDAIVEWAQEYYFIDDAEYARVYVESASKKYGKRRIVQALRFKGVDAQIIEDVLSEFDFEETKDKLSEDVQRRLGGDFERKNVDRVIRHFLTRGYAYEDVRNAIDMAKEACAQEEDSFEF